ncbi:hypothetical protein GS532_22720 [Rhodococcus hoagii]|nr:hypothetical protein [Prescottella equi]
MANTILKAEQILSPVSASSSADVVLPRIIASDASRHFSSRSPKNDTVSIRIPGRTVAKDKPWRNKSAAIEISDLNEFKIDVKLDTHPYNAIELTTRNSPSTSTTSPSRSRCRRPVRRRADRGEDRDHDRRRRVPDRFGDRHRIEFLRCRCRCPPRPQRLPRAAERPRVPRWYRREAAILKSDQFKKFDQIGDSSALRNATIANVAGFPIVVCNSIDPNEAYAFHRTAFQSVYRVSASPLGGVDTASGSYAGIAMRWVKDYDSTHMVNRSIFDTFFGISVVTDPDDYDDPASTKSLKRAVKLTLDVDAVIEVPEFKTGEPGFTKKLNQLADAVRELQQTGSSPARPVGDGDDFDPADFDVDEVNDYLADADDAERARILTP